jgi:3-methylcrotonyl-CoA carboxylase alpha subunit
MFSKILIANRGEIACRVIRTAHQMGIRCVAIYSTPDAEALHVKLADEAYWVGPAEAKASYLNQTQILAIAKETNVDAIHPGYGFLSENAGFAEACEQQGIVFIGAPSQAIRLMGSKIAAKQLMSKAQVPLLPGYHGDDQDSQNLLQEAQHIGFPVLIKASAGGGGKGMRVVENAGNFLEALTACQREAKNSFGSDAVLLEKYLRNPRHIEMQIFADRHGNGVHLFERDCSIQRRHQKVLEEAPAPRFPDNIRQQMGQAAINAAKSVGYVGAGTVEFLYDEEQFYFMEMNTRLQVEHPVTEMITGQDLVAWQLKVAYGEQLPLTQSQITATGHAIEARIYAEDPAQHFLPSIGTIRELVLPKTSTQVRLDSGVKVQDTISIYYDPMLAKLICYGEDRTIACHFLQQALAQYLVVGVKTNLNFLAKLVETTAFQQGHCTTRFIDDNADLLLADAPQELPLPVFIAIAAYELAQLTAKPSQDPWDQYLADKISWEYLWQEQSYPITACYENAAWNLFLEHQKIEALRWQQCGAYWHITTQNQAFQALLAVDDGHITVLYQNQRYTLQRAPRFGLQNHQHAQENALLAPMPGRIVTHFCETGQTVEKGQALLIMEAMKMEHTIRAPRAGKVVRYLHTVGDVVSGGDLLIEVE